MIHLRRCKLPCILHFFFGKPSVVIISWKLPWLFSSVRRIFCIHFKGFLLFFLFFFKLRRKVCSTVPPTRRSCKTLQIPYYDSGSQWRATRVTPNWPICWRCYFRSQASWVEFLNGIRFLYGDSKQKKIKKTYLLVFLFFKTDLCIEFYTDSILRSNSTPKWEKSYFFGDFETSQWRYMVTTDLEIEIM